MAEVLVFVSSDSSLPKEQFCDGDVIIGYNDRLTGLTQAQRLTNAKKISRNREGLLEDVISQEALQLSRQYRIDRLGREQCRRTELSTGRSQVFRAKKLQEYVDRLKRAGSAVYGRAGRETWYEGRTRDTARDVDNLWTMLESRTNEKRNEHQFYPLGSCELCHMLALPLADFSDDHCARFANVEIDWSDEQPEYQRDSDPENGAGERIVRRRRMHIDWRALDLPVSVEDVLNPDVSVDVRATMDFVSPDLFTWSPRQNYWTNREYLRDPDDNSVFF